VESYPYQMKEGYLLSVTVGHFYSGAVLVCLTVYAPLRAGFLWPPTVLSLHPSIF